MAGWVAWRRGFSALRVSRAELGSAALIGVLLPGANALLFVAEQEVPIGLASLVIASVPLLVVALRFAGGDRPTRAPSSASRSASSGSRSSSGREEGRARPGSSSSSARRSPGRSARISRPVADAAGCVRRDGAGDARRRARPAPDRLARHGLRAGRVVDPLDPRLVVPRPLRLAGRLHGVRVAAAERSDQQGGDLRLRQSRRRDRARRDRPARGDHLADRARRGDRAGVGGSCRPAGVRAGRGRGRTGRRRTRVGPS